MGRAKPDYVQRCSVIWVMCLDSFLATAPARQFLQSAAPQSICYRRISTVALRELQPICSGTGSVQLQPFLRFPALTIISADLFQVIRPVMPSI